MQTLKCILWETMSISFGRSHNVRMLGRYSVIKDITFVVKCSETFFSDFECVNLLLQQSNSAAGSDSRLGFFRCSKVVFMTELFKDVPT